MSTIRCGYVHATYFGNDNETLRDRRGHDDDARRDAVVDVVVRLEGERHGDAEEAEHHEVVDAHADHLRVVQSVHLNLGTQRNYSRNLQMLVLFQRVSVL